METKEIKFIVSNISPFNKLKEKEINAFISLCEVKEYKNREIIYKESDPPDYFYLLLRGRVVALTKFEGKESEIELLKRGTCFGMISIFTGEPHSVTTKSIEISFILRLEKDKFKDFLNKHPVFFSEFFRLFSQRVKRRSHPKKIFQCKKIAVSGSAASGKTTYTFNLATQIQEQTRKRVIALELSSQEDFILPFLEKAKNAGAIVSSKVLNLNEFTEESVCEYIVRDKIDYLLVLIKPGGDFGALLNFLSENYHFIIYEIPHDFWRARLDEFVYPADLLHFITCIKRSELKMIGNIIRRLKRKPANGEKIKVLLNEFGKEEYFSHEEKKKLLGHPIYATLPHYNEEDYSKAIRRISRQIGDVVLGVALGSGGAYAFSHIGVLKVLQENNVPIDVICGSSTGALVAALWAAGFTVEEMERIVKWVGRKLSMFPFTGISLPFKGLLRARRLEGIFKSIFKNRTFYDLKHTLRIVAFDFIRRQAKILEEGLLYKAVAASCAMPGMFEPIKFKKDILLDGGVLNPLPTRILLNYGANKIIAVNITPSREEIIKGYKETRKFHILDFIFGSIETMQREFIAQALKLSDVVIHPDFGGVGGWMEFEKAPEFIERGIEAARQKIEEVKRLVVS